jgi:hypothetical protein
VGDVVLAHEPDGHLQIVLGPDGDEVERREVAGGERDGRAEAAHQVDVGDDAPESAVLVVGLGDDGAVDAVHGQQLRDLAEPRARRAGRDPVVHRVRDGQRAEQRFLNRELGGVHDGSFRFRVACAAATRAIGTR